MTSNEFVTWRTQAACRDYDPDIWYPDTDPLDAVTAGMAKHICSSCPVLHDCLLHALEKKEGYGIWGGMTSAERNRLLNFPEEHRARILHQKTHPRTTRARNSDMRNRRTLSRASSSAPKPVRRFGSRGLGMDIQS